EALWPDEDTLLVANRFRVALASLRKHMEPAGVSFGTVLDASDPGIVRLRSEAVWCDTIAGDAAVRAGRVIEALSVLHGTFLPGYYFEWAIQERDRLEGLVADLPVMAAPPDPDDEESPSPRAPHQSVAIPNPSLGYGPAPHYLTQLFGRANETKQ